MSEMKKTSLWEEHQKLGAKFAPFAGWDMPLQYTSAKEESLAVRNSAGVFDVSHMGEFFIAGADAIKFVDYMITNDFAGAQMNKAVYSPLCREDGTVIDDLICYKLSENEVMICVNAANIEKDFKWLNQHVSKFDCQLVDKSSEYSLLALQGPKTEEILAALGFSEDVTKLEYYSVNKFILDEELIIARTGYTGEDGVEIFAGHGQIKNIWSKLMELNVVPCGLVARDVLRLEVAYPLYGHEINDEVTPLDALLKWTVKLDKQDFIGKSALKDYSPKWRLLKLFMSKGVPREGYEVYCGDKSIGKVTSGTMSTTLSRGIAIALVDRNQYNADEELFIDVRGRKVPAEITKKPFVSGGHK